MAKSLVVVESPAKAKTIGKYLGPDFEVKASVGHILDLPKSRMGVDLESGKFEADYEPIPGKSKVIKELKAAAKKADVIYLAPDPDREGEAIAFHIAQVIQEGSAKHKPEVYRIRFHEITKKTVLEAIKKPTALDEKLYDAQQARRILDRVVGYQISPVLWKKVRRGLSAGRVQSVAVRLVVDREREIAAFVAEEYWSIEALCDAGKKPEFVAKLAKIDGKKAQVHNTADAHAIKELLERSSAKVAAVNKNKRTRKSGPPFITSKLQQDAARAFRFTAKRTMALAQSLYEGVDLGEEGTVGLITYMRTDSTRVSNEALDAVRAYIDERYGKEYLPQTPNFFKSKKSAQEAHEAIRPTSLRYTPEFVRPFLKPEQLKLYKLIFERFVASQMGQAEYDQTQIEIEAANLMLRATGSILRFDGFLRVYREHIDEDDKAAKEEEKEEAAELPDVKEGDPVTFKKIDANQHFTEPPPRFSEASLVKELEEKGIGRPSTYAAIMSTIQDKEYVEKREARFYPTELGMIVTDLLVEAFPKIMDAAFTASLEEKLDKIEEGEADYHKTLQDFYEPFKDTVSGAMEHMKNVKRMEEATDIKCEKCGKPMVIKWGKNGSFLGCSGYPDCKNTKPFHREGTKIVAEKAETTDAICKECGSPMVVKPGRFGKFLGCSRYPDCTFTMPIPTNVKCPKDGGDIVIKRSRKGKNFYGCHNYPQCDFVTWNRPIPKPCPNCENPYLEEKITRGGSEIICPSCKNVIGEPASAAA